MSFLVASWDSSYGGNRNYRGDSNYRDNSGYRDRGICFYMGYNEKSSLRVGVAILYVIFCSISLVIRGFFCIFAL